MALAANLSLTSLFGTNATLTGSHPNTFLNIKISNLGTFDDTTALTAEGLLLAILQYAKSVQGSDAARVMEIATTPLIVTRGGDSTIGESNVVKIYSADPLPPIDPDTV